MSGKMERSLWRPLQIAILIQILTSTVQQEPAPSNDGAGRWREFLDTCINGGKQTQAKDLDGCKSACMQSSGCRSIDFDPTSNGCALLNTQDNKETRKGIRHYDFVCNATAVTPTASTPPTARPAAIGPLNCTGQNLTNTVVYENTTNATFPILANGQTVQWKVISASDIFNTFRPIMYPNGTMNPQFANTYTVTRSQLVIINATVTARQPSMPYATAGLYRLDYLNPNCTYGANLIVIRSGPDCSCNGTDPNNVQLICSVVFAEPSAQPNYPIFTWTDGTNTVETAQPMPSQISSSMKRATSTYIVDANDPTTYTCRLTFSVATQTPNNFVTSTAPTFTKSCDVYATPVTPTASTPSTAPPTTGVTFNCTGQNLTNTVVYENTTNASFPSLANGQTVQWKVISASDFFNSWKEITYPNGTMNPQFANTYTVTPSKLGIINATVTARQPSMPYATAGLYLLDYMNPNCTYGANLIVIRSGPDCSCNGTDPNNVQLICSVDFAESSVQPNNPVFTWTDGTYTVKTVQPMPSLISSSMKRATSTYIVDANDPTTYTCQLTFSVASKTPYNFVTSTAPTFTKSCQVKSCAGSRSASAK